MLTAAAGRLYWPLEQTLYTDVNYIYLALKGHADMLSAIFGGKKDTPRPPNPAALPRDALGKPIVLTPAAFDATFDLPNAGKRIIRTKVIPHG